MLAQDELFTSYSGGVHSLGGQTGQIHFSTNNLGSNMWSGQMQLTLLRYTLATWRRNLNRHRLEMTWSYGTEFSGWSIGWFNRDDSRYQGVLMNRYRFQQNTTMSIGVFDAVGSNPELNEVLLSAGHERQHRSSFK